MKQFLIRSLTSIVLVAIVVTSLLAGKIYAFIVFGIILTSILYESSKLFPFKSKLSIILYFIGAIIFYFLTVYGTEKFTNMQWGSLIIMFLLSSFIVVSTNNLAINKTVIHIACLFYITIPFSIFISLMDIGIYFKDTYIIMPLIIISTLWISDTMAYIIGVLIGKHKAFPRISPAKSWEGYIGGLILTIVIVTVFGVMSGNYSIPFWIVFSTLIFFFGSIGDLLESSLKRKAGLKDLSNILPGHGGLFDRFDSFIFTIPFVVLYFLSVI